MATETIGQALFYLDVDASATTTSVPTAITDGVSVPDGAASMVQIVGASAASAGSRSQHIHVYGWLASDNAGNDLSLWCHLADLTLIADTDLNLASGTDFAKAYQINVGHAFTRLATVVAETPGGTSPTLSTYIGFS